MTFCPICGEPNNCANSTYSQKDKECSAKNKQVDLKCWCFKMKGKLDTSALSVSEKTFPEKEMSKHCICQNCWRKQQK